MCEKLQNSVSSVRIYQNISYRFEFEFTFTILKISERKLKDPKQIKYRICTIKWFSIFSLPTPDIVWGLLIGMGTQMEASIICYLCSLVSVTFRDPATRTRPTTPPRYSNKLKNIPWWKSTVQNGYTIATLERAQTLGRFCSDHSNKVSYLASICTPLSP